MLEETHDTEELIERVAALDIGKAELVCCVRVPGEGKRGRRLQEVRTYTTMTRSLLVLADRLARAGRDPGGHGGHQRLLEGPVLPAGGPGVRGLAGECQRRQAPAGPAQDRPAGRGVAGKVAERQMLRPSFVPPPPIRRLRDVARYRVDLVGVRTAEKQRVEKLLEDAQIKLSVVASDIFGVSGRQMLAALIAGERDPKVLAQLARGRLRAKRSVLEEAFTGHFTDHHGFLLAKMLARVEALDADIAELDGQARGADRPFRRRRPTGWMRSPASAAPPPA